jgi:hypothetical protein
MGNSPFYFDGTDAQLDAIATNKLVPAANAVVNSKGVSWFEVVQIQDIIWNDDPKRSKFDMEGDVFGQLEIKFTVDPSSPNRFNVGRKFSARLPFNMNELSEERESAWRVRGSFGKLVQFIKAAGLEIGLARDPASVAELRPQIIGRRVGVMVQHRTVEDGRTFEDVQLITTEQIVQQAYA